ncbi:MAG: hypothetical protein HPY76_04145 [Anaerolineae bacterium]|nr:hypothetical protein [Anaerolineae bacterium]
MITTWLILSLVFPVFSVQARATTQERDASAQAASMLIKMTPEERVGQLFIISFDGSGIEKNPQLVELITDYHVGGVLLSNANDNFTGPENTIAQASSLVRSIQSTEWVASQEVLSDPVTGESFQPNYIPMFIAISQEGDLYPYDQLINGMTPLPSQMSIGATWEPEYAKDVGEVLGGELSALGVNMLLGPSLDVLDVVNSVSGEELGSRTFGGDPYWVGEMGKSFISGVHEGSDNQIAVVAKHFPGRGASDRPPEAEIATVRKSLEQLKQIELAPFFAVTGKAEDPEEQADGLMVSHIRYQGFQGNIRATTRPVSLDAAALEQIMSLEEFQGWRDSGGLIISDDLGSQAVKTFFDPTLQNFDGRLVARTAFLAGNDLLILNNFLSTGDPDSYTTVRRTLESFASKYREDSNFAQLVDESVRRVLTLKYTLYPEFTLDSITPAEASIEVIGTNTDVTFEVAQKSLTLISPSVVQYETDFPEPPRPGERILFITDTFTGKQCDQCPDQPILAADTLGSHVLRLYGPQSGGEILAFRLYSYSYSELMNYLNNVEIESTIDNDLRAADWIVFSMLNISSSRPNSTALQRLLNEKPDIWHDKKIIVFAMNAPYFLDATDISKLTAYFGLYSKTPQFVEVAARALFQEIKPQGAIPVSVPGIGYDLIAITSPDADQVIELMVDEEQVVGVPTPTGTQESVINTLETPGYIVGELLPLRTGVIVDHNGNAVPDGTVVRFIFSTISENPVIQTFEATTIGGIARTIYKIQTEGVMDIRVSSEPATTSNILRLDVVEGEQIGITQIAPTEIPTETPEVDSTTTPTPLPVENPGSGGQGASRFVDWLLSMMVIWVCAGSVYWIGVRTDSVRWGIRFALASMVGGLIIYIFLGLLIPDSLSWRNAAGVIGLVIAEVIGCLLGWGVGYYWHQRLSNRNNQGTRKSI